MEGLGLKVNATVESRVLLLALTGASASARAWIGVAGVGCRAGSGSSGVEGHSERRILGRINIWPGRM